MSMRPLHFAIPDPKAMPSGGNIYNQGLLNGLRALEAPIKISTQISTDLAVDQESILLVDTLFMDRIDPTNFAASCLLIVHHLNAMENPALMASTKTALQHYQAFLSTSSFTRSFLGQLGLAQPVITIPPALSFAPPPAAGRQGEGQKVLLVANLIQRKGILAFLKAWSQYQWPRAFQLEIIGSPQLDPDYAAACQHFVEGLPLNLQQKITFAGALPQETVFQKYRTADLFISPASMETFGMAIQEAIASGLPVLLLQGGYATQHLQASQEAQSFSTLHQLVAQLNNWSQNPPLQSQYRQTAQTIASQHSPQTKSWTAAARHLLTELKIIFPRKTEE